MTRNPPEGNDEVDLAALDRGTVVWCVDPFKLVRDDVDREGESPGRPVVIVSTDDHPFAGEQYVALSLTTRTWYADRLVELPATAWTDGGTPERSYVVPWSAISPTPDELGFWIGRLEPEPVNSAVEGLVRYLYPAPGRPFG